MRILPQELLNTLKHCTVYETLYLELANGTIFRFAAADLNFGGNIWLGRMKITSPLKMSLTKSADRFSFELSNVTLDLGRALIAYPNVFDNSFAIFGAYFKNPRTGDEWHDEKICGEIVSASIDQDKIVCSFQSELDAAQHHGRLISDVFPNAQLQRAPVAVDDFGAAGGVGFVPDTVSRKLSPLMDDEFGYGRYYLPEFEILRSY